MLDQATYTPRFKADYVARIRAAMKAEFGYKNDMQIPKLDKIVLNMGVGEAVKDTKKVKTAAEELTLIAGQKAVITHAKNSIAGGPNRVYLRSSALSLSLLAVTSTRSRVRPAIFWRTASSVKVNFSNSLQATHQSA